MANTSIDEGQLAGYDLSGTGNLSKSKTTRKNTIEMTEERAASVLENAFLDYLEGEESDVKQ